MCRRAEFNSKSLKSILLHRHSSESGVDSDFTPAFICSGCSVGWSTWRAAHRLGRLSAALLQVSEPRLIELLEQVSEQTEKKTKVRPASQQQVQQAREGLLCSHGVRLHHAVRHEVRPCAMPQVTIQRRRGALDDDW